MGPFLTELFPTRLRGSGQGFSYNFGHGIGALFPALVGYLSALMPLADAMSLFAVLAYGLFFSRRVCPAGGARNSPACRQRAPTFDTQWEIKHERLYDQAR
jgi:hypothetical protein